MAEIALIIFSLFLVFACGIFVAAEFSLITVNRSKVKKLANHGDRAAIGIEYSLKNLSTQLSGAQVGITVTNLCIGFLAEPAISALIEQPLSQLGFTEKAVTTVSVVIGITIATAVTMVFGELVPKNLALSKPLETARFVQAPQRYFTAFMKIPIKILNNSANFIIKRFGVEPQEELASARNGDELSSLVKRSAERGTLAKNTAQIIENTLAFDELTALDVITPRVKTNFLQQNEPLQNVIDATQKNGHSRFPVYNTNYDDIVGFIHVKHAINIQKSQRSKYVIADIMKEPVFAPSSIQLDDLLDILKQGGLQMAVVTDEFGGTDGIVTMEDIVEELVGEVQDEHDYYEQNKAVRKRHGGGWLVPGMMRPDKIGEETNIYLPETNVETIGGLIAHKLEHLPSENESIVIKAKNNAGNVVNVKLTVLSLDKKRIDKVHMTLVQKPIKTQVKS